MPSLARSGSLWALLVLVSILLSGLLRLAAFPAALLLGPLLAGSLFALKGTGLKLPEAMFTLAKAVIGCMVARALTPSTLAAMLSDWPVMLLAVASILASGALVGLGLLRFGTLPGSTAAWGTTPGGAAAMTALAQAYGADVRMVAFMQYLRMSLVVLTASVVSRFLMGGPAPLHPGQAAVPVLFPPLVPTLETLALIAGSMLLARVLPIPAGAMILPMIMGAALTATGTMTLTLPSWLLWAAYASLGWYVGLRFTPDMVRYALRAVPQMLLATAALIALCCGAAWMLVAWLHVDILSAYLATSPGGLDTVAAIALGSDCDVSFVLALQTLRLFAVVLAGPVIARMICRLSGASPAR
ncbi:AbrB family transcriptional regulator [Paucidesulfovibrio longus]|uniref:AbrB family transcriptional regulator n=1 Tax=Paucidesulfovibrio longus TaxID=889 RepID=UPI0003B78CEE|nr:AbrB family transcriptional regulator [Paucidesulfovibrio longus]